jgi:Domain of unknown function (DUF4404)
MDETTRKQMAKELERLRAQVEESAQPARDDALMAHVDELQKLVSAEQPAGADAHSLAQSLSERLLAWEAEHPKLTAFAARVAHALEDSGL